jgi:hypothetical protein
MGIICKHKKGSRSVFLWQRHTGTLHLARMEASTDGVDMEQTLNADLSRSSQVKEGFVPICGIL